METLQKKLQDAMESYKQVQKDYHKAIINRQQLDGQLNENLAVKEELDILKPGNDVFKLIGPVLIKQDHEEAKQNLEKRIQYISDEIKRIDSLIVELDTKQNVHRESFEKAQHLYVTAQEKLGAM